MKIFDKELVDFHPMDAGMEKLVWELRRDYEKREPERKRGSREAFAALLAGVPALRKTPGIPGVDELGADYFTMLPRCASEKDAKICRTHLKKVFGITDRASMAAFCNGEIRCHWQYQDFEGFWENRPPFALDRLDEGRREYFQTVRDFAAQFYKVTERQGFLAWDISECMGHLRAGYGCGLLSKDEFDELADYWIWQAQCFQSWTQYAVSLVSGALYWDFYRDCDSSHVQKVQGLWLRLARQLLENEGAWGSGLWYVPPREKAYGLWPSQLRTYLIGWDGPVGCFATDQITVQGKRVGWCYREQPTPDRPDSGWRFFSGEEDEAYLNDPGHTEVYDLNTICNYDPEILPLLTAPVGTAFWRDGDGKFRAEQYRG